MAKSNSSRRKLKAKSKPKLVPTEPTRRLLYSRSEACRMLGGVCAMTLHRLEMRGVLKPVKLSPGKSGRTYYHAADIGALVQGKASQQQ